MKDIYLQREKKNELKIFNKKIKFSMNKKFIKNVL